ncbi:hypothetical protein NLG97_g8123 [Lecanicillium saksenae]|uniref:Uncharacterized protein n=1 Tax=Lecanicillium saksenae TaxID=468837 RepID=A0ACC1QL02_9HYPO|nr:hypothetical protein NLG97_g8123 [Lecanicillium saksenae]
MLGKYEASLSTHSPNADAARAAHARGTSASRPNSSISASAKTRKSHEKHQWDRGTWMLMEALQTDIRISFARHFDKREFDVIIEFAFAAVRDAAHRKYYQDYGRTLTRSFVTKKRSKMVDKIIEIVCTWRKYQPSFAAATDIVSARGQAVALLTADREKKTIKKLFFFTARYLVIEESDDAAIAWFERITADFASFCNVK